MKQSGVTLRLRIPLFWILLFGLITINVLLLLIISSSLTPETIMINSSVESVSGNPVATVESESSEILTITPTAERGMNINNYLVYYGRATAERLSGYDLLIIQPNTLTKEDRNILQAQGVLIVVYLSIGEVETYRSWYSDGRFDADWMLSQNPNWGSYFIDTRETGWQSLMANIAIDYINNDGFDGIFLDTVDTVDVYPETIPGMVSLIALLRQQLPDALLIQNRGFTVLNQTTPYIDALMFESLSTGYNFSTNEYTVNSNPAHLQTLLNLQESSDIVILSLDYVDSSNHEMARRAQWIANQYNFVPAVAEISLQTFPSYYLLSSEELNSTAQIESHIENTILDGNSNVTVTLYNAGAGAAYDVEVELLLDNSVLLVETFTEIRSQQIITWNVTLATNSDTFDVNIKTLSIND